MFFVFCFQFPKSFSLCSVGLTAKKRPLPLSVLINTLTFAWLFYVAFFGCETHFAEYVLIKHITNVWWEANEYEPICRWFFPFGWVAQFFLCSRCWRSAVVYSVCLRCVVRRWILNQMVGGRRVSCTRGLTQTGPWSSRDKQERDKIEKKSSRSKAFFFFGWLSCELSSQGWAQV